MDIADPVIFQKRPWSLTVFSTNNIDLTDLTRIESYISQFFHKTLEDCQLSLFFQTKHDIAINYVIKYFRYALSEESRMDSLSFLNMIESYCQIACYLFWISILINEDYEVDFYLFLDQLHSCKLDEVECLLSDDFRALKSASKHLNYLPSILNRDPMTGVPLDNVGNIIVPEEVLAEMLAETRIREIFENLEENGKYFTENSSDFQIKQYEEMIDETMREISLLQPSFRRPSEAVQRISRSNSESQVNSSPINDSKFMAETIANLEREVQLVMDRTLDLELDKQLEELTNEQIDSCNEITKWSQTVRVKIADYFKSMIESGDSVITTHLPSQITQDIDLSSVEFEAKLQQTMEKVCFICRSTCHDCLTIPFVC